MKYTIIIACMGLIALFSCRGRGAKNVAATQNGDAREFVREVVDASIDSLLEIRLFAGWKYTQEPVYIINDTYVVYLHGDERVVLHPDMENFYTPEYYDRYGFALDKNGVWFCGEQIRTDTTGFNVAGQNNDYDNLHTLWKTKTRLFNNMEEIKGVDAATFEAVSCFNSPYFKDKNYIYYFDETMLRRIEGSDGASATADGCDEYCEDKNHCYYEGKIFIPTISRKRILSRNYSYSADGQQILCDGKATPIKPEDFGSVKVWDKVNSTFISDGVHLYRRSGIPEPDLDAKTFGLVPETEYFYDKNGVYEKDYSDGAEKENKKFPFVYTSDVTAKDLVAAGRYLICRDQVYDLWDKILYDDLAEEQVGQVKAGKMELVKIDGKSYPAEYFEHELYKANGKIYAWGRETIADAATFERIKGTYNYYKDKGRVYISGGRDEPLVTLKGIDAASVRVLNGYLVRDENYVYHFNTRLMKSSGIELLAVMQGYWAEDGYGTSSNYYLFKNREGYWLSEISDAVVLRFLGADPGKVWEESLEK